MLACTARVNPPPSAPWLMARRCAFQGLVRGADAVLVADRAFDHRFNEDPGEDEREHPGEGAGQNAAPDYLLFHCVD